MLIVCVVRFAGLATGLTAGAVASVAIFALRTFPPGGQVRATALNVRSSVGTTATRRLAWMCTVIE